MSSKTLTAAVQTALDLCRDAYGNGMSGQEERSLRYIALAVEQLRAAIQYMDSKGDVRKSMELEKLTKSLRADTHPAYQAFPETDSTRVGPAMTHWRARNLPDNVLRAMHLDTLPPVLQAALANHKGTGPVRLKLTAEQASQLFLDLPSAK